MHTPPLIDGRPTHAPEVTLTNQTALRAACMSSGGTAFSGAGPRAGGGAPARVVGVTEHRVEPSGNRHSFGNRRSGVWFARGQVSNRKAIFGGSTRETDARVRRPV